MSCMATTTRTMVVELSHEEIFAILTTKVTGFSKMTTIHWASLK
jgi:hypothetical protein